MSRSLKRAEAGPQIGGRDPSPRTGQFEIQQGCSRWHDLHGRRVLPIEPFAIWVELGARRALCGGLGFVITPESHAILMANGWGDVNGASDFHIVCEHMGRLIE